MTVIDSSGWIAFFSDSPKAGLYAPYLKHLDRVLTPAIVVYEVFKKMKRERGEAVAKLCIAQLQKTRVVPLDQVIALRAADLSLEYSLAMADAVVLATALSYSAELLTSDADFRAIPGVRVL